jgi:hypothetical protein
VRCSYFRTCSRILTAIVLLSVAVSPALADPMPPSYTLTDLGAGNAAFSTDASGNGIVIAPGGQVGYAFPRTQIGLPNGGLGNAANFPLAQPAPVWDPMTYGNPSNAYSYSQGGLMNANGIAVAVDYYGVTDHYATGEAYFVQRNADGSWGIPVAMWYGQGQFPFGSSVPGVSIEGINKLNQVLGTMTGNMLRGATDAALYNIYTGKLTDLSNLGPLSGHYSNVQPIGIDDLGRILLEATPVNGGPEHALLLTPDGVTSDPIIMSTPEPGSWAAMTLAVAAFAAHRARERRRRS